MCREQKRRNKISKYSEKYFTDSDIVHYGLISIIHTFGRDLKWNPHIHAIVSLGGFTKNFDFREMRHFNVDTIAGQWKYHVLKIIQNREYHDSKIKKKALDTVAKLYKENIRFFFNVVDGDINSTRGIIRYLGRYLARSPIAEYKITEIDDDKVTFFFNDLANNKMIVWEFYHYLYPPLKKIVGYFVIQFFYLFFHPYSYYRTLIKIVTTPYSATKF